jgi:hypothetical protein
MTQFIPNPQLYVQCLLFIIYYLLLFYYYLSLARWPVQITADAQQLPVPAGHARGSKHYQQFMKMNMY